MLQNFLSEMFISGVFCSCCPYASCSGCCRDLAGMLRCHCGFSGAGSAASWPPKSSLTCRQPRRNPLSFYHVLAVMLSVHPSRGVGAEYPTRIAAGPALSHPSLSITWMGLSPRDGAESRDGAAGVSLCPTAPLRALPAPFPTVLL